MSIFDFFREAHGIVTKEIDPLEKKKDPGKAVIWGFLLGPFGVGFYFRSWRDFFLCMGMLILLIIVLPVVGGFPGWIFSAAYGYFRAESSNRRIDNNR